LQLPNYVCYEDRYLLVFTLLINPSVAKKHLCRQQTLLQKIEFNMQLGNFVTLIK